MNKRKCLIYKKFKELAKANDYYLFLVRTSDKVIADEWLRMRGGG